MISICIYFYWYESVSLFWHLLAQVFRLSGSPDAFYFCPIASGFDSEFTWLINHRIFETNCMAVFIKQKLSAKNSKASNNRNCRKCKTETWLCYCIKDIKYVFENCYISLESRHSPAD
jgi:hypothetical protein